MKEVTPGGFGLTIAYLIPGFIVLWSITLHSAIIHGWITGAGGDAPTIGGFLYVTIASLGAGIVVSTIRWLLIDTLHHRTGIPEPAWDFGRLQAHIDAFDRQVEGHYRFYQAYSNSLIAITAAYLIWRASLPAPWQLPGWIDIGYVSLAVILWLGSRDTLRKYHLRVAAMLGGVPAPPPMTAQHQEESSDE
jgi:hypothetical protein